ncbi:MAG: CYTH domain-containing protein [Lachnospiraceae bacterium]|nr:CYTH domain-containing protein [Lachnospiraceae bacterium]
MEIEKKFLVKTLPDLEGAQKKSIEQGYLCRKPVLRIRRSNEQYILTYKSNQGFSQKNALQNEEVELPLTEEAYLHLRGKTDGCLIEKTRYVLPLADGLKAELDIFEGKLDGLVFVEVEFESEEQAVRFQPPQWFGEEVSDQECFSNAYLSGLESFEQWEKENGRGRGTVQSRAEK